MSRTVKLDPKKPTLVLFHKPGCPACIHFMPIWNSARAIIKQSGLAIVQSFARNNEPVDSLMQTYNILSYPTVLLFHHGKTTKFQAERTVDNLVAFVRSDAAPETGKPIIIFLHWSKCGHCHTVRPTWDQLKDNLKNDMSVKFEEYEAEQSPHIMKKFGVSSYPTFLRVQGNTVAMHEGERSYEKLLDFIKPKIRSIEPAPTAPPKVVLNGYKQFTDGTSFWAIRADRAKNTICTVEGKLGATPTMQCRKYTGKDINAFVKRQIAKKGWMPIKK
uniref:Thioredoxin domain-containing protein n=1 Tax=viral metagenome TaxID=1070528 RepID=A0A6C0CNC0_9ZZZZ